MRLRKSVSEPEYSCIQSQKPNKLYSEQETSRMCSLVVLHEHLHLIAVDRAGRVDTRQLHNH
jgi:hypothetical protein